MKKTKNKSQVVSLTTKGKPTSQFNKIRLMVARSCSYKYFSVNKHINNFKEVVIITFNTKKFRYNNVKQYC